MTGGSGMLARNLRDVLNARGPTEEYFFANRDDADLTDAQQTRSLISYVRPRLIIHAAARVAGFAERQARPLDFLLDNVALDGAVVRAALEGGVEQFLYVGSALAYPPTSAGIRSTERDFLRSGFKSLSSNYGLAKAVGMRLVESAAAQHHVAYRVVIPSNLYGPHDHFSADGGHVVPAALVKAHLACGSGSSVRMLGDGRDERQFTFAPDLAQWMIEVANDVSRLPALLNVGGDAITPIGEVYREAVKLAGCGSPIEQDLSFSSVATSQLIESTLAHDYGWAQATSLSAGMAQTHGWYLSNVA
ncbi:NAD-dependent epimerase/dehydratase family protein [Chryseoglobus sp. 28M-23]|uniref:NAD-dependent epimerase/dehydratase family protein n=1 Tax=Chryseoglobus sp. 28M-23 TaxID=2772253 RepID=UPI00210649FE|nr:NAD-dependent epimerase/dehydratase family protein [Chryseoglobus sp. 28M-23]